MMEAVSTGRKRQVLSVVSGLVLASSCLAAGARPKAAAGSVQQLERGFVADVEKVEHEFAATIEAFEKRFEKALVALEKEFETVITGLERRPKDKRLREQYTVLLGKVEKLGQQAEKLKRTAQFLDDGAAEPKRKRR